MRVMTWNLWWQFGPWESRQSTIASTLADQRPDIVCLQEVWSTEDGVDQARQLGEPAGLHVARTAERFHKGVSFGNAILSRWPILETESRPLPPTGRTGAHRFVLYALIDADAATTCFIIQVIDPVIVKNAHVQDINLSCRSIA